MASKNSILNASVYLRSHAAVAGEHVNVGFMTSGGLAPCLSSSIAQLAKYWIEALEEGKISGLTLRMYVDGYAGILTGNSFVVPESEWKNFDKLNFLGGSPIGNSRVKLTNLADCEKRGFTKAGEQPLEVASKQLILDNIKVLHTIGGDDTNTQAAVLSKYIKDEHNGSVIVIGMPKTIDNDVIPIAQTFGADTAARQGAIFFENIVNESTANPRMLVLHEVMGRDCGFLTAKTAQYYREILVKQDLASSIFPSNQASRDIHAIWIPELELDLVAEGNRLKKVMDENGCVNVFFGEGTGVEEIVRDMEANGENVPRDAFGHVTLNKINPGQYFSKRLAKYVEAEKTIVQKSGYFSRSAAANEFDRDLIGECAKVGVASAIAGVSGCMGEDEDRDGTPIRPIEFERIKGGKAFDLDQEWFQTMLKEIGQI
jgi:pyrophosphate--fructose-6-phosphate 1-phosphotransferase